MTLIGGLLADLVAANRVLLAEVRGRLLASELRSSHSDSSGTSEHPYAIYTESKTTLAARD